MSGKIKYVALADIRIDGGTQSRVTIDERTVTEYADEIGAGKDLDLATVFFDGADNWLADGFHRYHGATKAKKRSLRCEIFNGTRREAVLHSVGANAKHGLRRSNEDKRKAVETLLKDEEWGTWSNNKIAEMCHVSSELVADVKKSYYPETDSINGENRTFIHPKTGQPTTMNTANIGAKSSPETFKKGDGVSYTDPMTGDRVIGQYVFAGANGMHIVEDAHSTQYRAARVERFGDNDFYPPAESSTRTDESEPDSTPDDAPTTLQERAANAQIVHDTLTGKEESAAPPVDESELTDEEWLQTIPAFRVLATLQGKGIIARHSLLDYRTIEKALGNFQYHAARTEAVKHPDNTPFSTALLAVGKLRHPRKWGICPPCKGGGCTRCGSAGYDMNGGIEPERIERGEVNL